MQLRSTQIGTGRPKVVVPVVAKTQKEIFTDTHLMVIAGAELVEWRADFFEELPSNQSVLEVLKGLREIIGDLPLIFTVRTRHEGGQADITDSDYSALILFVSQTQLVDLIDVELFRCEGSIPDLVKKIHSHNSRVIMSNHDFQATPLEDEIVARLRLMQAYGGDVLKMAVMPDSSIDVLTLLSATNKMATETDKPIVTMSMGKLGVISRIAGEIFHSSLTFGTVGKGSAPGQIAIDQLKQCLDTIHTSQSTGQ